MFKRTWDDYPVRTGPQVEFMSQEKKWVFVQQVFSLKDKQFLKSVGWATDKVAVSV